MSFPDEYTSARNRPRELPRRDVSGVHEARTEPAPYLEDVEVETSEMPMLVGSVPIASIDVRYEAVVAVRTGETVGHEVYLNCVTDDFRDPEDVIARADFEHRLGELGRVLRDKAIDGAASQPLFIPIHRQELKEGLLIRPDDPMAMASGGVYLQLRQPSFSTVCLHVLRELAARPAVCLVIDGLGGTEASIAHVIDLSPACVKLDVVLTAGIEHDPRRRAAVGHLTRMCAELGCAVVARDVSTPEELAALVEVGVSHVQGPLIVSPSARPRPGRLPT